MSLMHIFHLENKTAILDLELYKLSLNIKVTFLPSYSFSSIAIKWALNSQIPPTLFAPICP